MLKYSMETRLTLSVSVKDEAHADKTK